MEDNQRMVELDSFNSIYPSTPEILILPQPAQIGNHHTLDRQEMFQNQSTDRTSNVTGRAAPPATKMIAGDMNP